MNNIMQYNYGYKWNSEIKFSGESYLYLTGVDLTTNDFEIHQSETAGYLPIQYHRRFTIYQSEIFAFI